MKGVERRIVADGEERKGGLTKGRGGKGTREEYDEGDCRRR